MTLYLISAWALVLIYCGVIAAWTGGLTAPAIGVGTLVLGAIVLQSVSTPAAAIAAGVVRDANRAFLALLDFGGRRDEVIGLPIANLVHPLDQGRLAELVSLGASREGPGR